MTDFRRLLAADHGEEAVAIRLVSRQGFDAFRASLTEVGRAAVAAAGFRGRADTALFVPEGNGRDWFLAAGLGEDEVPGRWTLAAAAALAPEGRYRLTGPVPAPGPALALHGWLMAQHRFERYRKAKDAKGPRQLLLADPAAIERALAEAEIAAALRDMVDTPAEDLGPGEVEAEIRALSDSLGGRLTVVTGEALNDQNFPAIHAVGRASPRRPRLLAMDWGDPGHPLLAIVGKGVCFDTGGLNLKPGNSMGLMKKDMGGAAHAIALAKLVIARRLKLRLRLVVAAVDNAVSGDALRPGDVIATRKGLSVEVGNTDAEGRLVLADALAFAVEAEPALILDFATLTGAARVALGPDLPALFANDEALADGLLAGGAQVDDPLWRLPLWQGYRRLFRSDIADLNNNAESGFAGAIVGGLFLERFVAAGTPWAHMDIYAWNPTPRPGRPKGAAAMALFAALAHLESRFA
ncbi:leucyl aminopeptidase family protein [Sandaracinobacter sp. RS1-74]|uniref:leucyl aminopeptidase family protein n=1 Tax=Sandaracinobacteroides sayramensis TaxID=2913411 RepID=UPI001EDB0B8A|nr:leucyl aminopeptidase family protein [Sandaracinobacteroides sayramensis]MCG2840461.1 leucyl aminopeptidase family protein [Sandaracinobacteroides sayramensis]